MKSRIAMIDGYDLGAHLAVAEEAAPTPPIQTRPLPWLLIGAAILTWVYLTTPGARRR